ncbi:DNRLRE domain-containing protein, partial [Nocardioides sp.]|uniref:DNRLRE domain-containing protein n=1 Tax=Nocardioides sp. TaxID=35761 RepID=UPI002C78EDF7
MEDTEADRRAARHDAGPATGGLKRDDRLVEQPDPTDPTAEAGKTAVADTAAPAGFDAATSKELPAKGAKDRQVFVNPDGSETTRYYTDRQMFRDADGEWRRIESDLESANGRWKVKADDRGKSFAARADAGSLASVELVPGTSVGFSLRGAAASQGAAAGNRVRYDEVRPGADLELEANPLGLKETIILKSPEAPTVWDFPLDLNGTRAELVGREVQLLDADGVQVGRIPPGFMTDSNIDPGTGDSPRSEGVTYTLIDSGQTLRVSVDEAWLAKPERKYPVFVDPTVTTVETNGDTYVMGPYTNDYSGESELKVGTYDGGAHKAAALLRFSMSGLTNHKVTAATLNLRATHSYSCSARDVVIRPLTESWTVSGNKTWPGPSWGSEIARKSFAAGYSSSCADKWVNFDVTSTVNSWTHGSTNNGLRVGADGTDTYAWKKFASANSTNAPYLQITHTAYWADYSTPTNVVMPTATKTGSAKITVTNRSAETWTPSSHVLSYRIWDTTPNPDVELTASSYLLNTALPSNVAINGSVTLTGGIQKLPPGNYQLKFDMVKTGVTRYSSQGSPMSSPVTISIVAGKPSITSWSPNAGFQADTRTPTLVATGEDSDNYPKPLTYQFKLTKPDGVTLVAESAYGPSAWTVPAGKMEWGKGYLWFVRATDGTNVSSWSPGIGISAKVGQPTITSHLGGTDDGLDPGIGNFSTSAVDAMVTVVGPDLAVERTYNSLDSRADRAYGAGWSTAWDIALTPEDDGSGNVLVTFADGQQARYGLNSDGTYATPPGQQGTLVATSGGGWTLRDVGDVRYRFDATGGLLSITDASGHVQSLTRDAAGHVTRATDDVTGRYLDFDWTSGHVTKVTTGPTPALAYTYTYSGDTLTEACDPEGACVAYDYTVVPQQRTVLLDANPTAYWRMNDAGTSGTSASAIPGIWRTTDATRTNTSAGRTDLVAGSNLAASRFNGTSSKVTLPAGLVQGAHLTLEMWFNTTASGALFGAQNWALGGTAGTQSSATLYVGADGKLRGLLPNGTTAPMTSTGVVNDGTWHHVALSGAGATQSLYLDGSKVATVAGQINWQAMTNEQIGAAWTTGAVSAPATGASFFNGDIAEVAFYQRPLGDDLIAEHFAARNGAPKLTTVTEPGHTETTTSLAYDAAAERVSSNRDANGGTWRLGSPVTANAGTSVEPDWRTTITVTDPADAVATYVYDPMRGGQMMSLKAAGDATATTYEYDSGGFPFQITDPNGHVTELRHDERGNEISRTQCRTAGSDCYTSYRDYYLNPADPLDPRNDQVTAARDERSANQSDDTYATTYTYYANGELDTVAAPGAAGGAKRVTKNVYTEGSEAAIGGGTAPAWLLKTVTEPGDRVTSYAYRSNGDLARETDPAGLVTTYEYDGIGRNTAETTISSTVPSGARTTYAYDGVSRVLEEVEPAVTNAVTGTRTQQKTTNTWRPDGELDKVVVSDALGTASRTTDFGFDGYGRETSVTEADGAISRVTYDQFGQAATRTDPGGTVWTYTYTGGKRQLATTRIDEFTGGDSPATDVVLESRAYDPGGRLASVTDAMGTTIEYTYFDDDLLAAETVLDYKDPNTNDDPRPFVLTSYTYTGTGAVKELTEGDGRYTTVTAYD